VYPTTSPTAVLPSGHHDFLSIPSLGMHLSLGVYADCNGVAPMTRLTAVRVTCIPEPLVWLAGHNPGVFTPLTRLRRGAEVDYWDSSSRGSRYRLADIERVSPGQAGGYATDLSHAHLVLQTCALPDGSQVWLLIAEPA
jgi:sortase (surface protein transpeptidase)